VLIQYIGPHAHGVEVDELPWLPVIERDVPTEVPEEIALRLLQQETNWVESKPAKGGK
jgi:hypothetical protein